MLKFANYKLKYTPDRHTSNSSSSSSSKNNNNNDDDDDDDDNNNNNNNNNNGLYMQPQTQCSHKILQRRTEFTVSAQRHRNNNLIYFNIIILGNLI